MKSFGFVVFRAPLSPWIQYFLPLDVIRDDLDSILNACVTNFTFVVAELFE